MDTTVSADPTGGSAARSAGGTTERARQPFGGGRFRSRFTDAVWQGPTWSFAILLAVLRLVQHPVGHERALLVTGFVLVMVMTLLAVLVRWESLPSAWQVVLPLGDLVGAVLMVAADPTAADGIILLCSLPVVWLAFEFGVRGMAVGMAVTTAVGVGSLVGRPAQEQLAGSSSVVLNTLFVLGLAVTARLMSRVLDRVGATLQSHTEEAQAARALAEEQLALTNGVMASIDVGVIVMRAGAAPVLNEQARVMVGRMAMSTAHPERGGRAVYSDAALTAVPAAEQVVARAVSGEEFTGVMQWVGPPGDQRVLLVSARQLVGVAGAPWATVLAMWDATELVDAIQVREDFLTTVSHELRTPLTAIIASLEVLTDEDDAPDRPRSTDTARLFAAIERNAGLLAARIDELLTSAAGVGAPIRPARTDVTRLVRSALTKHDAVAAGCSVTLRDRLDREVAAVLDPVLFEQVVDNLVTNAVKYTGPGGQIEVALRGDGHKVALTVADSGAGMTFDEQRQAFDRFYRAPRARAGAVQGLGIGLSLVRAIVERHHGTIDLRSAPGAGTTVTVVLPAEVHRVPDQG